MPNLRWIADGADAAEIFGAAHRGSINVVNRSEPEIRRLISDWLRSHPSLEEIYDHRNLRRNIRNVLHRYQRWNDLPGSGSVPLAFLTLANVELPGRDHGDDVIQNLASTGGACAAKKAADARCNARGVSERTRRYSTRSCSTTTTRPTGSPSMAMESTTPPPPKMTTPTTAAAQMETMTLQMLDSINIGSSSGIGNGIGGILSPSREPKNKRTPSSAVRLAQSHVKGGYVAVTSLDFEETERTNQELDEDRREHDMHHPMMNSQLQVEVYIKKLEESMKKQKEDGRIIASLRSELARSKSRADAADEDAQAAIDIATEVSATKQQVESLLEKALEEIELLRNHMESAGVRIGSDIPMPPPPSSKTNLMSFAESPTVMVVSNQDTLLALVVPKSPRTLPCSPVGAGRNAVASNQAPNLKMHQVPVSALTSRQMRRQQWSNALDEKCDLSPTPSPTKTSLSPTIVITDGGAAVNVKTLVQQTVDARHVTTERLKESALTLKIARREAKPSRFRPF